MIQSSAKPMVISYASPRNDRNFKRTFEETSLVAILNTTFTPSMGPPVISRKSVFERSLMSPKMGNQMIGKNGKPNDRKNGKPNDRKNGKPNDWKNGSIGKPWLE